MALAAPTNITISDKVFFPSSPSPYGSWDGNLSATVAWTNNEVGNHVIEVYVNDNLKATCEQGTTFIVTNLLSLSQQTYSATVTIKVRAISPSDFSSYTTQTFSLSKHDPVVFPTPSISGRNIVWGKWGGNLVQSTIPKIPNYEDFDPLFLIKGIDGRTFFNKRLSVEEIASGQLALPNSLIEGKTYIVEYYYVTTDVVYPFGVLLKTIQKNFYFTAPAPVATFEASVVSQATVLKNESISLELKSNYEATWTIVSGAPSGAAIQDHPASWGDGGGRINYIIAPLERWLVITPTISGSYTIVLKAVRNSDNAELTMTTVLTVVDAWPKTTISSSGTLEKNGISVKAGDSVNLAFVANPADADWKAVGLPNGLTIVDGVISGKANRAGVFYASITAKGRTGNYMESDPIVIKFTVTVGDTVLDDGTAAARSPWLLMQWELIDLHVVARTRDVQSTMFSGGMLRIKSGDALKFGIFFVDAYDQVFAMAPDRLRISIRRNNNLDEAIVLATGLPPTQETEAQSGQVYYTLEAVTDDVAREQIEEWIEEAKKNDPLPCLADIDWTLDGKTYSSKSFPVALELDVTRP